MTGNDRQSSARGGTEGKTGGLRAWLDSVGDFVARPLRSQSGVSAVEFALITPIILILATGVFDFGIGVYHKMALMGAARSGAQFAMLDNTDMSAIRTAVRSASGLPPDSFTVTMTEFCECDDGSGITCGDTCGDGSSNRYYMTVNIVETYVPVLWYTTFVLTGSATVRTQ